MVTILTATNESELQDVDATDAALWISEADLEPTTGWALNAKGFCRGSVCVPRPAGREAELARDGRVDVAALWKHLGWPAVASDTGDVWALAVGAGELSAQLDIDCPRSKWTPLSLRVAFITPSPGRAHQFQGDVV